MFSMTAEAAPPQHAAEGARHVWELTTAREGHLTATGTEQSIIYPALRFISLNSACLSHQQAWFPAQF